MKYLREWERSVGGCRSPLDSSLAPKAVIGCESEDESLGRFLLVELDPDLDTSHAPFE